MLAAFEAACCAANGVPLRDPRKPSDPELFHASTLPVMTVMVTMVLLKEACTCTNPWGMCLRSFFLNVFFLPFFSGAAAPPAAAAGLAIFKSSQSLCLCRRLLLLRDRAFARTLAGTGVGMGALSANRQIPAM